MERPQIPMPLQTQILLWLALTVFSLIIAAAFMIFFSGAAALPFLLLGILTAVNGGRLYYIAAQGHYLVLTGTVLYVEYTAILHRPKAVLIEVEGIALRVLLHNRRKAPIEGGHIALYVQDSAPIYEWRGIHLLDAYLAAAANPPSKSL
jgi:hypothetical protein